MSIPDYCGVCGARLEKRMGTRVCEEPKCRAFLRPHPSAVEPLVFRNYTDPRSETQPPRFHVTVGDRKHRFYDRAKAVAFWMSNDDAITDFSLTDEEKRREKSASIAAEAPPPPPADVRETKYGVWYYGPTGPASWCHHGDMPICGDRAYAFKQRDLFRGACPNERYDVRVYINEHSPGALIPDDPPPANPTRFDVSYRCACGLTHQHAGLFTGADHIQVEVCVCGRRHALWIVPDPIVGGAVVAAHITEKP